ncbi:hypothetical protein J4223_03165 [Candidatus Woesearchaeota archaeon]|nr:hypothetical protein [Candidatus Woesearchaeota archaeon]
MIYRLIFDEEFKKQLKKAKIDYTLISNIFDKIEQIGPDAGKLIDSKLFLYEFKMKRPPLRIYFKPNLINNDIYMLAIEMKKSEKMQQKLIDYLKRILREKFFFIIFFSLDIYFKFKKTFIEFSISKSF